MPPTYGGLAIFGRSVRIRTVNDPSAAQVNAFFGLSGVEHLYGGLNGRVSLCSGVLQAINGANLAFARESFRSLDDGVARVLVDTLGEPWPWVILHQFDPGDRIMRDARGYWLAYRAVFRHLS